MLYKRGKVWWFKIKWHGRLVRRSTGTGSKDLARKIEIKVLNELAEGKWFEKDASDSTLFSEVWEKYLREEAKYKSQSAYKRALQVAKNILPALAGLTLSRVSPAVLSTYRAKRLEQGVCSSTVVKELQFVRRVFSLCKREWQLIKQSPFEFFRMPRADDRRVRFLESGQFENIISHCPAWLRPLVIVARFTGLRRGNILNLTWSEVDFERRVINIERTKNGQSLTLPIADTPHNILFTLKSKKIVRLNCPYVFHREDGKPYGPYQVSMAFKRACRDAKIKDFHFHDLRHDFASALVQRGNDLYIVQSLLGHKDGRMTQRYAHLRVENLREAVESLEGGTKKGTAEKAEIALCAATS